MKFILFFCFLSFSGDYLIKQIFTADILIDKIELVSSGQYCGDHFLCQIPVFFQLIMNQSPWIYEWNDVWFVKNVFMSISVDWCMKRDFVHVRHSNKCVGGFLSFWTFYFTKQFDIVIMDQVFHVTCALIALNSNEWCFIWNQVLISRFAETSVCD